MKLPYLAIWDITPVIVTIQSDGIGENGEVETMTVYEGKCNYVSKTKTVVDKDGRQVAVGGVLTIKDDIAPAVQVLAGYVELLGQTRNIHNGSKILNPDGSVNHTRLELL